MDLKVNEELLEKLIFVLSVLSKIDENFQKQEEGSDVCFEEFVLRILEMQEKAA